MFRSLLQNTRKPAGKLGRIILKGMNVGHAPLAAWGLSHLDVPSNDPIQLLDIGCGGGANIAKLLQDYPHAFVTGVDYSPDSVAASCKTNANALEKRCEIVQGDVGALPFSTGRFHAATAFETVYFWPDIPKALSEIKRVLQPGGMFLLCCEMGDPSDTTWTSRIDGMTIYSGESLKARMEKAGFVSTTLDQKSKSWICVTARTPQGSETK